MCPLAVLSDRMLKYIHENIVNAMSCAKGGSLVLIVETLEDSLLTH